MQTGSDNPFHSDPSVFRAVVEMTKMGRKHPIQQIARNPQDYKYCERCGKINWHGNRYCNGCGHRDFNPITDEYGQGLLLDWEKEPDLLLEL